MKIENCKTIRSRAQMWLRIKPPSLRLSSYYHLLRSIAIIVAFWYLYINVWCQCVGCHCYLLEIESEHTHPYLYYVSLKYLVSELWVYAAPIRSVSSGSSKDESHFGDIDFFFIWTHNTKFAAILRHRWHFFDLHFSTDCFPSKNSFWIRRQHADYSVRHKANRI